MPILADDPTLYDAAADRALESAPASIPANAVALLRTAGLVVALTGDVVSPSVRVLAAAPTAEIISLKTAGQTESVAA